MIFSIGLVLLFTGFLLGTYINETYIDLELERTLYSVVRVMLFVGSSLITISVAILAWELLP